MSNQMEKLTVTVNGVRYEITVTRKQVKRLTLRIDRQGQPCLTVPVSTSRKEMTSFVESCGEWLARHAGKRSFFSLPSELRNGDTVMILGEERRILLQRGARAELVFLERGPVLIMRDPEDAVKAAAAYKKALTDMAMNVFRERLRRYLHVIPRRYGAPEIKIRTMTSRWGSANPTTNEIHLSLYLIKTPLECVDSVILHEAVHYTHMDHGSGFYDMLLSYMPDYRKRSAVLKSYART